jgi:hypothetical protein
MVSRILSAMRIQRLALTCILAGSFTSAFAQQQVRPPGQRATVVRETILYVSPDKGAQKVGRITPGREMVIAEHSGKWYRVFANTDIEEASQKDAPIFGRDAAPPPVSGWLEDKGVVTDSTPQGDIILYGEAATQEVAASERHSPPRAAQDARLLYRRLADFFPNSKLAPEGAWRAADIRWQFQKADAFSRPSAQEREAYLRERLDDDELKKIEKQYPHTKWADLAAFNRIDNQICGDWQGSEKCPEKESSIYEKYADEHPEGPKTAEALYNAVWRQAVLVDMYDADDNRKRSEDAKKHATALAARLQSQFATSDYAARAQSLVYKLEQGIPVYGNERE